LCFKYFFEDKRFLFGASDIMKFSVGFSGFSPLPPFWPAVGPAWPKALKKVVPEMIKRRRQALAPARSAALKG